MSCSENLMSASGDNVPRFYDVDKGSKTESYITAVSGNPFPTHDYKKPVKYSKVDEVVTVEPDTLGGKCSDQIGLTEAELSEYKDDPFWRTMRLILFVLFWLLWIIMFIFAILLVLLSPGCVLKVKPNWWQTAVAYNVWVPSFQDSDGDGVGDIQGLISRLENLRKSGVQTVWPSPFLLFDEVPNAVRSYSQIDSSLGVNQLADVLVEKVHEKDMKVVINLPIATTSVEHEWFLNSASASKPENKNYSQFYHWSSKGSEGEFFAPYKSLFYLHEKGNKKAAVLNWQSNLVRSHMFDVLSEWIDRGVDGFHLTGIEYLARTPNGTAPDWSAISDVLRDIHDHVSTYTRESIHSAGRKIALFASREEAKEKDKRILTTNGLDTVINYELGKVEKDSEICHKNEGTVATCVHEILSDILLFHSIYSDVWPQWEFGNPYLSRVASRVGSRTHAELLLMLQLILPGTNNIYYGEELGMRDLANDTKVLPQRGAMQWDDSESAGFSSKINPLIPIHTDYKNINWERQYSEERSPLKMFSKLAKLRQRDETLMGGQTIMGQLVNGAFTVTRFYQQENITTGNIYVAALNFAQHPVTLPLVDFPSNSNLVKSQIVATTSNVGQFYSRQTVDLKFKSIQLNGDQGVVFRYPA